MADRDLDKALRAWHASPYDFDRFGEMKDVSGKGQGAAAYGRGAAYVAESPAVSGPGRSNYMEEFERHPAVGKGPYSYEVRVHLKPETMLDWDDLLVNHHSEAFDKLKPLLGQIKSGTDRSGYNAYTMRYHEPSEGLRDGADLYKALTRMHGSDIAASEALFNAGIHGIRYKDAGSRNNWYVGQYTDVNLQPKWGVYSNGGATREAIFDTEAEAREHHAKHAPPVTYNYVIFHPDLVEAIAQYNIKGEKVRDMGPGVHLKAVDHDPFKGEK